MCLGFLACGCATASRQTSGAGQSLSARSASNDGAGYDDAAEQHRYRPAAASALAFDPPLAPDYPLLGLDRDSREPGAFIGYQDSVTEYFASGLSDNQSDDPNQAGFDRWSSSTRVGVRYR